MEEKGYAELALEGISRDKAKVVRKLDMRYVDQIYEVSVDVSGLLLDENCLPELRERLDMQHEKEYTYRHEAGEGEIINAAVTVIGHVPGIKLPTAESANPDASHAQRGERRVFFQEYGDFRLTPIYDGSRLRPGNVIIGPVVVEEINTTIVVFPGWQLEFMPYNCYVMRQLDADG
jgi:N-methylhydantoinase A